MDADNSGSITVEELKAGMKKAGSPVALAELQALLAHIDVDANGAHALPLTCPFLEPMPILQPVNCTVASRFCAPLPAAQTRATPLEGH